MFLIQKYTQYKAAQAEQQKRKVTEKELCQLNHKIDKLLTKLDEHEPEIASNQDEECVVCVNAKATMQTYPCGHRVICRKCFVKTIQTAVAQRLLPLRCVICRAKILRLKHVNGDNDDDGAGPEEISSPTSASSSTSSSASSATSALRKTISHWYKVPQSDSLYSVTSNASRGSSASSGSTTSSFKTCASTLASSIRKSTSAYAKMGYEQLTTPSSPSPSPPTFRKLLFSKRNSTSSQKSNHNSNSGPSTSSSSSVCQSSVKKVANMSSSNMNKPIPNSRSSIQLSQQRHHQQQQQQKPISLSAGSKTLMPKKENRIVPVQTPKPIMSMGLKTATTTGTGCNNKSNSSTNTKSISPTSPSSSTSSSSSVSSTTGTGIIATTSTPLKGKFKLVQEFQREFHIGREKCLNQGRAHHNGGGNGGGSTKSRCTRQFANHPHSGGTSSCHSGISRTNKSGILKDKSIHSISSCIASIPSSNHEESTTMSSTSNQISTPPPLITTTIGTVSSTNDAVLADITRTPPPSSQSCPSFKQFVRPPQCNSHYHHYRCNGCSTDRLRKLEPLIEVK